MHSIRGYHDEVIVPLARFVMDLHREAQTISFGITLSIAAVRDLGEADFGEQPLLRFD